MFRFITFLFVTGFELFLVYRTVLSYQLRQTLAGLDDPRALLTHREQRKLARSAVMAQETQKILRGEA